MSKTLPSLYSNLRKMLYVFFLLNSVFLYSQATVVANPTNAQINSSLNGPNLTITGGTLVGAAPIATVRAKQVATFTNGIVGAGLGLAKGAYFSTGDAVFELSNKNSLAISTKNPAGATPLDDDDLKIIDPTANFDLVSYSFTITLGPAVSGLKIGYQFGSEEFPNYVGSIYNDVFGFFLTGPGISGTLNMATLPNGNATSINKVNSGVPGSNSSTPPIAAYDGTQSALYINNGHTTTVLGGKYISNTNPQPGPFPVFVEFNGLTKLINRTITGLTPGATYTFKVVIADAGDYKYDSGVFIDMMEGMINTDLAVTNTVSSMSPQIGCDVTFTLTASNAGPGNATNTKVTDLLPSGYTFVSATPSAGTYNSVTGVWDVGLLNIGAVPTLQIVATVNPSGVYLNTATIASGDIVDINATNDSSSVTPVPTVAIVATNTTSTAAICENTAKALTATPAGGTWSVLSGGGTILGTTYTPADVAADTPVTIRYTVAANGSCAATTSDVAFTVNIIPTAPTVGTITQPTCLLVTGSVVLNDLPAGDWTINPGNITGNTATTTISGLAAGTTFNYTVTLSGCTSGSVKVVINNYVCPVADSGTAPSTGGEAIPNVALNDVVNGLPATLGVSGNATIATSGVWPVGVTLNPTTGAINVAVGTIPGVYPVTYQLCDKLTPQTCATVVNTVTVTAVLNPVADSGTAPSTGGEAIPNVALNDVVNGLPATLGVSGNATIATSGVWP
ncbi:DUF11 domain-containing protein, partial [Flavobacterium psychrophilum]|uniref:DUF11 domain-containing protein n=1 Tax=Flavobacterium psychrophilum TaxID=96345 RepID=UPI000B75DAD6